MTTRREFLQTAAAILAAPELTGQSRSGIKSYGIAYTSFPIRLRQGRQGQGITSPVHPLPAEKYIDLCHSFGANGCQMDFSQLTSAEPEYLQGLRQKLEANSMFMEFAVSARLLENPDNFAKVAFAAQQMGVSRLRIACLSGRRYETFHEMATWKEFDTRWKNVLQNAEPMLKQNKLYVGVENHKDWLADELVEILKTIGSPHLGACVDFGNNVALLEDPVEVARKLAPYAVTTHLKDMAVRPYPEGFELSEVALGDGTTPLAEIAGILRKQRPEIHFCLEMITRDPLKVPYKTDHYWVTFGQKDESRIRKFENTILKQSSSKPLPKITGLNDTEALAFEDANVRRSGVYAKKTLKL
ncbi:MAG: sugar phosphate isomerase/epimerase [Acidobacteria bacterium]|nr:sugar phosphate isomerase/epimerase [Acidobacteriota bacterium]